MSKLKCQINIKCLNIKKDLPPNLAPCNLGFEFPLKFELCLPALPTAGRRGQGF
jgi:hypothetical protein